MDHHQPHQQFEVISTGKPLPKDGRAPAARNLDFELIEAEILSGDSERWTVRAMAAKFGVNTFTLSKFMNLPAYKARNEELKRIKAQMWAEEGWHQLTDRHPQSNWDAKIMEARSNYCVFMAKVHDQATYGSKQQISVTTELSPDDRQRRLQELEEKAKLRQIGPAASAPTSPTSVPRPNSPDNDDDYDPFKP